MKDSIDKTEFFRLLRPHVIEHFSRPYSGPNKGKEWPDCFTLGFKRREGHKVFTRTNREGLLEVYAVGKAAEVVRDILGQEHEIKPNSHGGGGETFYCLWRLRE